MMAGVVVVSLIMPIDMPRIITTLTSPVIGETMKGPRMLNAVDKLTEIPANVPANLPSELDSQCRVL